MSLPCIDVLTISFLWINQCCSFSSMHPPSPINLGEAWTKQIYEAVRGSPQWNNTLFIITFDEHGVCSKVSRIWLIPIHQSSTGFFRPRPSTRWRPQPWQPDLHRNCCWWQKIYIQLYPTGSTVRLNLKAFWKMFTYITHIYLSVPTIAISPWVQKGIIEHSGINNGLVYSHSSIAGFISKAKAFHYLISFLILTEIVVSLLALESWRWCSLDTPCRFRVYFRASHYEHIP